MLILIRMSSETAKSRLRRTLWPCQVFVLKNQMVLLITIFLVVALNLGNTILSYRCGSKIWAISSLLETLRFLFNDFTVFPSYAQSECVPKPKSQHHMAYLATPSVQIIEVRMLDVFSRSLNSR